MPAFCTEKDICYALLYNQFTTKIMLEKDYADVQKSFYLRYFDTFGIKDSNIVNNGYRKTKVQLAKLPKHLCFDEFHSTKSMMPFICCDSETHQLVVKLLVYLSTSID